MKLNLLMGGGDVRGGYVNIDPLAPPGDVGRVAASVFNLDHHADDASATEIIALDVIDYAEATQTDRVLDHWVGKLRHGGVITVGGVDIREVAKSLLSQQVTLDLANRLLYGEQQRPWQYRKATMTLQVVISALQDRGLRVESKRVSDYYYTVTARRP